MRYHRKIISRRDFLALSGIAATGMAIAGCRHLNKGTTDLVSEGKSKVAIAKAESYDIKLLRENIRNMFDQIGGLEDIIKPGSKVAIKVNLTGGLFYSKEYAKVGINAHWTHPEIVRAVGEALIDAGAKELVIMEGLFEENTFELAGYPDMVKALGARLINLEKPDPHKDFIRQKVGDDWFIYEDFIFNPSVMEADVFVTIPKLKCHGNCGVTLAMKNHIGLVPVKHYCTEALPNNRSAMHGAAGESGTRLPKVIVDMLRARPIDLVIIDGIRTTEGGEGPWVQETFKMVKPGVLIAGKNPVSTDAVATAVMGFNPSAGDYETPFLNSMNHLVLASEKGLGTNILEKIDMYGTALEDAVYPFNPAKKRA